jgi:alpha-glucosidase (family GH31 glycosyl hydrolase)
MIPTAPPRNYVGEKPADPITFNIYPTESGSAAATLYEDDGLSPAYKTGLFLRTTLSVKRGRNGFEVSTDKTEGQYKPGPRRFNFVIKGWQSSAAIIRIKT